MNKPYNFLLEAAKSDTDDCVLYPYSKTDKGYGTARQNGNRYSAHRLVCELVHGEAPTGAFALHSCGNGQKGCVNPKHLRWGSAQDNADDREAMGNTSRGSKNGFAKLDEEKVVEIRALRRAGLTLAEAGRPFGVSKHTVSLIMNGTRWAHV
jgi:hypothetical protein